MIVWGHGLERYQDIIAMVHTTTPSVRLWYQKITSVKDIGKFVQNLYQEDVARVGGGHISAKTAYLKTKGNKLGVVVLFDPNRVVMTYGNGKWKISANKRMVDLKWTIRRAFNPNPDGKTVRDQFGVFSHHHVVHVSDTTEGVDPTLKGLGLPTTTTLQRTHHAFFTPWFIGPPSKYKVETVPVASLQIGCAATVGKCQQGKSVSVSESLQYAFAVGKEDLYAAYYSDGLFGGRLTDDHTVESFRRLRNSFVPEQYPPCQCGYDGVERRAMIVVGANNRILDGAHRAALLLANHSDARVPVVRMGVEGKQVDTCQRPVDSSSLKHVFQQMEDFGVEYVVLRGRPLDLSKNDHPDIDLLVANYAQACAFLTRTPCPTRNVKLQGVHAKGAYFDLRVPGDNYYPPRWAAKMMKNRVRGADGLWHLNGEDQYFAILYHAVVHKGHIGSGYLDEVRALSNICTLTPDLKTWVSCLKQWMQPRYEFSNTCHNCGGNYLTQVGLLNLCGKCAQQPRIDRAAGNLNQVTFVSALLQTNTGKHTEEDYTTWMKATLSFDEPMVVFTDKVSIASHVRKFRAHAANRTIIVPTSANECQIYARFGGTEFWEREVQKDSEAAAHRDWRLYVVWGEKTNWLHTVAKQNPFESDIFAWMDIGFVRTPQHVGGRLVQRLLNTTDHRIILFNPLRQRCPHVLDVHKRIYFGKKSAKGCQARRTRAVNDSVALHSAAGFIAGGIFLGTQQAVQWWHERFIQVTDEYASLQLFIGKEQYQYASIAVQWPQSVVVVKPHTIENFAQRFGNPWFSQIAWLRQLF